MESSLCCVSDYTLFNRFDHVVYSAGDVSFLFIQDYKGAVGFGQQINELEAMRLQGAFADGVRGLNVAGAVVLNADGVATLTYTIAEAEA